MIFQNHARTLGVTLLLALVSCASGLNETQTHDGPTTVQDLGGESPGHDLFSPGDLFSLDHAPTPTPDSSPDLGPACEVGTLDNCAHCGDRCPGADTPTTARICRTGGICDIECKDEYYDVNGDAQDGCELADDLPIHDGPNATKNLGSVEDCDNAQTAAARIPSDDRNHQKAPTERKLGRADWFSLHIADKSFCIMEVDVTFNLAKLPSAATFRLTVNYLCDNHANTTPVTRTVKGGTSTTLSADTGCTSMSDDSGKVQIGIERLSGPHSQASYSISIQP